jgi:hypothetical protein
MGKALAYQAQTAGRDRPMVTNDIKLLDGYHATRLRGSLPSCR